MRDLAELLLVKHYGDLLILSIRHFCKAESSVLGGIDHHVPESGCQPGASFRIGFLICDIGEGRIVIYLEINLGTLNRSSVFRHNSDDDLSRLRSIVLYHVDLRIIRILLHDFLRSVISADDIGVHEHSAAAGSIEPREIQNRLRLTGTQEAPFTIHPGLHPGMIAVGVGPARRIDLTCRDTY